MTDLPCDQCGKICVTEDDHTVTEDGEYLCNECFEKTK